MYLVKVPGAGPIPRTRINFDGYDGARFSVPERLEME
jgi:hypothetical protein